MPGRNGYWCGERPSDHSLGLGYFAGLQCRLFDLVPSVGEPAKFGFSIDREPVILDTSLRTGGDYGVTVSVNNITEIFPFFASTGDLLGSA